MPNAPGESSHQHFKRLVKPKSCSKPRYVEDKNAKETKFHPEAMIKILLTPNQWMCFAGKQNPKQYGLREGEVLTVKRWEKTSPVRLDDIADTEARLCEGLPLDPTTLDFDVSKGKVLAHDGRHRVAGAYHVGVERIPTIIRTRNGKKYRDVKRLNEEEKNNLKLLLEQCGL